MHHGHHELTYVVFSALVAVLGSWTALDLHGQVRSHGGRLRLYWLAASAAAMGLSIFSMHFIAMLGFDPGMPMRYDIGLTIASLLVAIGATSFAFVSIQAPQASARRIMVAALFMGSGICLMHYLGMAAIRTSGRLTYDPWLVAASFLIAVGVSWAALLAALKQPRLGLRFVGAVVLGLAICSMHYTGMWAATFTPIHDAAPVAGGIDRPILALWIGTGTMTLLLFALISALFDRRFEAMALREASAVAERESHLRAVLERMPLAVAVVRRGEKEELIFTNRLADDWLQGGCPAQLPLTDIEGQPLKGRDHPFWAAMKHGDETPGAIVGMDQKNGERRFHEVTASCLPGGAGPDQVVLTAQDVTARLDAEQALRQSQKMETIGQLTGGVAHDFNNLLTPIVGGLDMLRRDKNMTPQARRVVEGALQASNRATTLVQRLLAFSRRQALQPRPLDMGLLINGLKDLIERSIGPTIRVSVDTAPGLVTRIDPGQFELAILNLAVNARDAMPDGGLLWITASSKEIEADNGLGLPAGEYVRISVADSGVGMDAATLKRAVEPFFSTKGLGKGTGLGLSMVHGLAAQSKGALNLSSTPGSGTCAALWFPRCDESAQGEAGGEESREGLAAVGQVTLLLVDDEELVRRATAEMLEEFGYRVVQAASAIEALQKLEINPEIAMVISDHLMPGMSGADFSVEVRGRYPGRPFLLITGYANPEELPASLPRLMKPFTAYQLGNVTAQLLRAGDDNVVRLRPTAAN